MQLVWQTILHQWWPRVCREERQCRFCGQTLPDWKQKMTPKNVTPCPTAVMAVVLNGEEHRITVEPGPNGRKQFEDEIRRLFGLSQDDELEFTFDCQAPSETVCPSSPGSPHPFESAPGPTRTATKQRPSMKVV